MTDTETGHCNAGLYNSEPGYINEFILTGIPLRQKKVPHAPFFQDDQDIAAVQFGT